MAIETPRAICTSPSSGLRSPVMTPNIVDFPAPFCPIRVNFDPRRTGKETSSKIGLLCPYSNETFSNRITTSPACAIILPPYLIFPKRQRVILWEPRKQGVLRGFALLSQPYRCPIHRERHGHPSQYHRHEYFLLLQKYIRRSLAA